MLKKHCLNCHKLFPKPLTESLFNWKNRHKFCSRKCVNRFQVGKKKPFSQRKKISSSLKITHQRKDWGFKKGHIPWIKGKKGIHLSPASEFKKGNPAPKTAFKKGHTSWNKGKKGLMPIPWNKGKPFLQIRGENHWNWNDNASSKYRSFRRGLAKTFEYRKWRNSIILRDNNTCKICGLSELKRKQVDHYPVSLKVILNKNNIRTIEEARKCKELWKISNGRTLCPKCHRHTPTYGKKALAI